MIVLLVLLLITNLFLLWKINGDIDDHHNRLYELENPKLKNDGLLADYLGQPDDE